MKCYHVEYDLTVNSISEWHEDKNFPGYKLIDPGYNKPYVYIPPGAKIKEVSIPKSNGIYITSAGSIYKKSLGKWYYWNGAEWALYDEIDDDGFTVELKRIDA